MAHTTKQLRIEEILKAPQVATILKIDLKSIYRLAGGGIPGNRIGSTRRIRRGNILYLLFRQMEERQRKLGKGTGLGLSIPHGIVTDQGGEIRHEPAEIREGKTTEAVGGHERNEQKYAG